MPAEAAAATKGRHEAGRLYHELEDRILNSDQEGLQPPLPKFTLPSWCGSKEKVSAEFKISPVFPKSLN